MASSSESHGTHELNELLARVKAATGPDRELDDAIRHAIDSKMVEPQLLWRETLPYTASIDAALALTERMLPEKLFKLTNEFQGFWRASIGLTTGPVTKTAPLAILAALLTALSLDTKGEKP